MSRPSQKPELEQQIMDALKPVLRELRMISVSDFISYLHFNQHNYITDIFESACEQYFAPDLFGYRGVGTAHVDWGEIPSIELEIVMNTPQTTFEFGLILGSDTATIRLHGINEHPSNDKNANLVVALSRSIAINTISKSSNN